MSSATKSENRVSKGVPFLNTKFLLACLIFSGLTLGLASFSVFRHGLHWENMLLGLPHDIGVLPVIHYAGRFPELAHNPQMLEEAIHALRSQIGVMVLRQWEFADETVQVCLGAENWQRDPGERPDYTDAVLIAQRLADALLDKQPPMQNVCELPAFNKLARGRLNDEEVLQELLTEAQQEITAVFQLN